MKSLSLALASCLFLASCGVCTPPPPAGPPVRKVTVIGAATIKVVPDQMLWNVNISVNDATLAAAKTRHDASLTQALAYLKAQGDSVKDLQTGGIRIDKQTYFPPNSDHSKPFTCSTQITFTLTDFDKYGAICDELAKFDGVQVQGVDYAYSKQSEVQRDALKQALTNAADKAGDLAGTANCTLSGPLDIQEGGGFGMEQAVLYRNSGGAPMSGTPAAVAGQIEIKGTVTATYEIRPK